MNIKKHFPKVGDKYGQWTLIEKTDTHWVCQCSCGKIKNKEKIYSLLRGNSISCGCFKDEFFRTNNPMFKQEIKEKMSTIMKAKPEQTKNIKKAVIAAQSQKAKEKRKATNLLKYGSVNPALNQDVKSKTKQTNLIKYGATSPAGNQQIIQKMKDTCKKKYGTSNVMKLKKYKDMLSRKIQNTKRERGTYLLPSGIPLVDYCRQRKIRASSARNILKKYGEKSLMSWLESYSGCVSALEIKLDKILKNAGINATPYNKQVGVLKEKGYKYRPDIKLMDKEIYVDVDGLYIHAATKKKKYHIEKGLAFSKCNIKLFQFYENEIRDKENIVISIIKNSLGQSKVVGARSLEVRSVPMDSAQKFIIDNHLMGIISGVKNIALTDSKGQIFSIILYKKYKNGIDISRFATKCGYSVAGGLSRLLKHIEKNENPKFIQSFVDLRYSDGHSLERIGFKKESVTLGWKWTNGKDTFNRLYCRANMDKRNLSEKDCAKEKGLLKLYDAGQAKYVKYCS
jgi:hypothetical protein